MYRVRRNATDTRVAGSVMSRAEVRGSTEQICRVSVQQVSTLQRLVTPASTAAHAIKVVRLKVAIDKRLTVVDERSPAVLKYKTPHFRCTWGEITPHNLQPRYVHYFVGTTWHNVWS